jgi:Ca2+-binding EF-hand superfamily protein
MHVAHTHRQGKGTALDYLGKYCILNAEQLRLYQGVFNNIDRDKDGLINYTELDFGIKTVNRSLLSNQEFGYVTEILEVSPDAPLNFRMFAVTAALSQRVVGLEPIVKRLIDQMDFAALHVKLQKSKDLFYLLDEKREGIIRLDDLLIELQSG